MAASLQGFLGDLRAALRPALCLHDFPSPEVEGHNKPQIEVAEPGSPLVLPPVTVQRAGAQVRAEAWGAFRGGLWAMLCSLG